MNHLVREVVVDPRPEAVVPFLSDPALMVRWMGTEASREPHPGGEAGADAGPGGD